MSDRVLDTDNRNARAALRWLAILTCLASGGWFAAGRMPSGDFAAWLVVALTVLAVAADDRLSASRWILAAVVSGLAIRHVIAFANAFYITVPGAEADALNFHMLGARAVAEGAALPFTVGSRFYSNFLALVYALFGSSKFLGEELSVATYVVSCATLVRFCALLEVRRFTWVVLLSYALWPSVAIHQSITLREGFEVMFFMLAVFFGAKAMRTERWWYLVPATAALLGMGMFHQILLLFAAPALVVMAFFQETRWKGFNRRRLLIMAAAAAGAVVAFVLVLWGMKAGPGDNYIQMMRQGLVRALIQYRHDGAVMDARSAYAVGLDPSNTLTFIASLGRIYLYYLFGPFPWQVTQLKDVVGMAEAWARLLFLVATIRAAFTLPGVSRRIVRMLLILFAGMTFMWAAGSVSFGQAVRHNVLTEWIMVLAGVAWLERATGQRVRVHITHT